MLETIIVIAIVAIAAALIIRQLVRNVNGEGDSCACSSSCGADCKSCPAVEQAKKAAEKFTS